MTLDELIEIVDEAYPNGLVGRYHHDPDVRAGDTLASFIAMELKEIFDEEASDNDQILTAMHALEQAQDDIDNVIWALDSKRGSI